MVTEKLLSSTLHSQTESGTCAVQHAQKYTLAVASIKDGNHQYR